MLSFGRLPAEFSDPRFSTVTIQRDLFYGYDTLMENVSDPSHIDFAHHKVTGRRDRAKPLPFKVAKSGYWGFAGANNDTPTISSGFYPPCYFYNKYVIFHLCCMLTYQYRLARNSFFFLSPNFFSVISVFEMFIETELRNPVLN